MSTKHYYKKCCEYRGKPVMITTRDGKVHRGVVERVTPTHVYLRPMGRGRIGGFGYYGYGYGWGIPIALGAIAGIALATAFWW